MTPTSETIRKQIREKRRTMDTILAACDRQGETRDMSPAEAKQFDTLLADVTALKQRLSAIEEIEGDEEDAAKEAERSRRSALPGRKSPPMGPGPYDGGFQVRGRAQSYSILRALRLATDGQRLDGIEGEVSQEIARRSGRPPKGFFMPTGTDPEIRALMNGGRAVEHRDLTTTTGAGAIFTTPDLPLIELLRDKLVVKRLGATMLTEMSGVFAIPRQATQSTVYWLAEGVPASTSNPSLDQVPFTPRVAIAGTNMSRQFMNQTSVDAETFTKNDLAASMARELDRVAINGAGGTQPLGILQNPAIQTASAGLALGPNGGPPTWGTIVGLETLVSASNADMGKLAYLVSPVVRGALKQASKSSAGYPIFVFEDGSEAGVGEMNGYPAFSSNVVPSNLTKGSGTNLAAIIYGNWEDLVVAQWEGVDLVVNPYTNQMSGSVTISMEMSVDVNTRHNQSFAIVTDASH